MGGLGSAVLGALADKTSIEYVYSLCAYLPLIGLLTAFLPGLNTQVILPVVTGHCASFYQEYLPGVFSKLTYQLAFTIS
jgi:hypothetical protein